MKQRWLLAGTLAGLALAAVGLWRGAPGPTALPDDRIAAWVNDAPIRLADYALALEAVAGDKRNRMSDADRRQVLDRLVDEQLLVQRGVDIGLLDSDDEVRAAITDAMLRFILADAGPRRVDDAELRAFYDDNLAWFTRNTRAHVQHMSVAETDDTPSRLAEIRAALRAGDAFRDVAARYAAPAAVPLPATMLPPAALRNYLGDSLAETVLSMAAGSVSDAIRVAGRYHFVYVVDAEQAQALPFEAVREQVRNEFLKRRDDAAVRQYLDWLRQEADIRIIAAP